MIKKLLRFVPFFLLISGFCFYPVSSVFAEGENDKAENEIKINISPKNNLFDISNMKPGDWAPRSITVQNSGSKDFDYHLQLQNSGDNMLFNELLLEIKAGDLELYQGELAAFESLPERKLASGTEENLEMTIRFPEHLGNEFQGLSSAFVFSFTAEGTNGPAAQAMIKGQVASSSIGPTSAGFSLPTAKTNISNLMLFVSVLVAGGILLIIIRHKVSPN